MFFFFLSGFSFTYPGDSQDNRGKEGTIFYSTLQLTPVHEHSDIYLQRCMWDDYHVFLIAPLIFTRLLPPYWITVWFIDDAMLIFLFVCLMIWSLVFVTAIWHVKPVDLNSHRLSYLYYKRTKEPSELV